MNTQHIHILKTGGTIEFHDSDYEHINNKLLQLDSSIEGYLSRLIQPHFTYSTELVFSKDSRDIDEADLHQLVEAISASAHTSIIITHGTFTMNKTAEFIGANLPSGKKIVLTGAMIPIAGFAASDAGFNLGFAIGLLSSIKDGVYLAMNGGIFAPGEVNKNSDKLRFE